MPNVFISYARKSIATARTIHQTLKDYHFYTWIDYDSIQGGDLWEQEIFRGLSRCDTQVVLIDEDSVKSEWVKKEVSFARERGLAIFPILIRTIDSVPNGLAQLGIDDIQAIDFVNGINPSEVLKEEIIKKSRNNRKFFELIRLIKMETDDTITQQHIDELADLDDRRATYYLIKILSHDDEYLSVYWSAIDALGRLKDHRAIPILKHIIMEKSKEYVFTEREIEIACIEALCKIGGDEALEIICYALYQDNLAYDAIQALAHFRNEKSVQHLTDLLSFSDEELAQLFTQYRPSSENISLTATRLRIEIVKSLGTIGDRSATPALMNLLRNHSEIDYELLRKTLHSLIETQQISDFDPIKEIIQSDYLHGIRGIAIILLGYAREESVLMYLVELLDEASVTPYVATAFEILGDQRAVPHLQKHLSELQTNQEYTATIPNNLKRAYYKDTIFALQHALYALGHKIDSDKLIFRSHMDK